MIICELVKAYIYMALVTVLIPLKTDVPKEEPEKPKVNTTGESTESSPKEEGEGKGKEEKAGQEGGEEGGEEDGSAFAEMIFNKFRRIYLDEMSEVGLPEFRLQNNGVDDYVLNPGSIGGLNSLHRRTKFISEQFDEGYHTSLILALNNVSLDFHVKTPLFEAKSDIIIEDIQMLMNVTFSENLALPLFVLEVMDIGEIKYLFNGQERLTWLTNLARNVIQKSLKSKLLNYIRKTFRTAQAGILRMVLKFMPINLCKKASADLEKLKKIKDKVVEKINSE